MNYTGILTILALAIGPASVAGQQNPFEAPAPGAVRNDTMHLTVQSSISKTDVTAGDKVSVRFAVTPKRNMHVYAPGKHDYQVIAVKIDPQPWLKAAPTTYPPSEIYHMVALDEKVETYAKPFTLVQELTILDTADARKALAAGSTVKVSGRLEYQACDDKVCYAPARVPISFSLAVK